MNPVERTWRWWTHIFDFPLWDPWLATIVVIGLGLFVFFLLNKLLRP